MKEYVEYERNSLLNQYYMRNELFDRRFLYFHLTVQSFISI